MGLLDGNLDPQTMAQLQLAGGLLSPGSFGQGLSRGVSGYQGALSAGQNYDINAQKLQMEKLQFASQLRMQNLINDYISGGAQGQSAGGAQSQDAASPNAPQVSAGGALPQSGVPPQSDSPQPTAQSGSQQFGGLPRAQVLPELMFNGGKNMGEMVRQFNTPISMRPGGYGVKPNGETMQYPVAPEGFTTIQDPATGGWKYVPVAGGPTAIASTAAAKASGPAGYQRVKYLGADGSEMEGFAKDLLPMSPTPAAHPAPAPAAMGVAQRGNPAPGSGIVPTSQQMPDNAPPDMQDFVRNYAKADPQTKKDMLTQLTRDQAARGQPVPAMAGAQAGIKIGFAPGVVSGAEAGAKNAQTVMTESYKDVSRANQPAQTVQARLDDMAQFAKVAILGGDTQWRDYANNLASIAGLSERATDRKSAGDLLDKNASQIALAIGSGSQGTDALRSLAQAAFPSRKMTQSAINSAVEQLKASAQVAQAKSQLLTPLFNAQKPADYSNAEQTFDKNADYRLWQISADTKNMAPAQIVNYLQSKGYTPSQVAQFQAQRKSLSGLGVMP